MKLTNQLAAKMKISNGTLITFHKRSKVEITFASLFPKIKQAASFFRRLGFNSHTVLGIIGKNDLEWIIADLASIYCGIKLLPLETNADFSNYHSDNLKISAILISPEYTEEIEKVQKAGFSYILLDSLTADPAEEDEVIPHVYGYKEVVSYKSTSGSTGLPKVIGHCIEGLDNSVTGTQSIFGHSADERILVFLPLNLLQQRYWIYSAIIYEFTVIVIPKNYVFVSIRQDRPTVIMGVPYLYEIIHDEFKGLLNNDTSLQEAHHTFLQHKQNDHVRFAPFDEFMGGHINYLWTGSAPISKEILEFYFQLGMPLYQGYGMNETCIIAKNYHGNNKIGSVGKLFPGMSLRFDDHRQIIVKSDYPVCNNYTIADEADKLNTFLPDGSILTGDCGFLDEDGFLFINGRIKDMIILSNSKKIFPRSIEEKIELTEGIEHCIVFGDNKPYLVAIIVLSDQQTEEVYVQRLIEKFNEQAKEEEKIFRYNISFEKFSEQNELLSNQNKIKRQKIYQKFHAEIEELYN